MILISLIIKLEVFLSGYSISMDLPIYKMMKNALLANGSIKVGRTISILIGIVIISQSLLATDYNNEWINYSKTYYKIKIGADGLYRIPYETLLASGISLDASQYALFRDGEEKALYTTTSGNVGPGDYVEFLGLKNNGDFDTQLYKYSSWQPSLFNSLFTDTSTYFLVADATANHYRYSSTANALNNLPTEEIYYWHTEAKSFTQAFNQGEPTTGFTDVNTFYADFEKGEGFGSALFPASDGSSMSANFVVNTPNVFIAGADSATITMRLIGRSNNTSVSPDHHVQISISGVVWIDDTFEGYNIRHYSFKVPVSTLGVTTVITATVIDDLNQNFLERNSVSEITISYPRVLSGATASSARIVVNDLADHYMQVQLGTTATAAFMYDNGNSQMMNLTGENGLFPVHIPVSLNGMLPRDIFFFTSSSVQTIAAMESVHFRDFSQPNMAADYIIIYHSMLRQGQVDQVQRYADYRHSADGGAYTVLMVDIAEIYDQFGYGIAQHPVSIQQFNNFIIDKAEANNFPVKPALEMILGKSVTYNRTYNNPLFMAQSLVPTYGHRGSDNMLTARNGLTYFTQLGIGRISASSADQVRSYLDKVIEYESWQTSSLACTKEDRLWMKHLVHLGGGNNSSEATEFTGYLNHFKEIAEDTLMGGKVLGTFVKSTEAVIPAPPELTTAINNGLAIVTFIGHSNAQIWSYDLHSPDFYNNLGKYPFFLSNSCFVGNIHDIETDVMALNFVLAEDRGAIAFLATVGFGFPYFLNEFCGTLYQNFSGALYGQPLGSCIKKTISDLYDINNEGRKITCQEFTLEADPAIKVHYFQKPEYLLDNTDIIFDPAMPSAQETDLKVILSIYNLGKATGDSIAVSAYVRSNNGAEQFVKTQHFPGIHYNDSITMHIDLTLLNILGPVEWIFKLDPQQLIAEDCEENNISTKDLFIQPTEPRPLEPCNFSIVNSLPVTLIAGTANPLDAAHVYSIQIDTEPNFTSPALRQTEITQSGGLLRWIPDITYNPETVYYWRVSRLDANQVPVEWKAHSFIYLPGSSSGWNQSDYGQYISDGIDGLVLSDNAVPFAFVAGENGTLTTPAIGPAKEWQSLDWAWQDSGNPNQDQMTLDIMGIGTDGSETLLYNQVSNLQLPVAINAAQYPFLKLKAYFTDTLESSPPQLRHLRIHYQGAPEYAFDPAQLTVFHADTLWAGETGSLSVGWASINSHDTPGTLQNQITIVDAGNNVVATYPSTINGLEGPASQNWTQAFGTSELKGSYRLIAFLNADNGQTEKYNFNNLLSIPFYVMADEINPVLDITFDGRHILSGDLVSVNPEIFISVRDENHFLLLQDTTGIELYLRPPGENSTETRRWFSSPEFSFVPAPDGEDNVFKIYYHPTFSEDGIWQMRIKASDRSGNASSANDYVLRFEVKSEMSVSHLLNYPNPFTTSTRFIFMLTGSEVPDRISLQILNVTGRVVKEFSKEELGPLHIGQNITEMAWDGRDTYGNELANGVYFYRAIIEDGGQKVTKYNDDLDVYFSKKGWGKMYKLR